MDATPRFGCMPPTTHTTNRAEEIDPKFYIPASPPTFVARRAEGLLSRLFAHAVEPPA